MRITIAERLHPYSHLPGDLVLLPGSTLCLQVFPALIRLYDLSHWPPEVKEELPLTVRGPVKDFTIVQDLERGELSISFHAQEGYCRYRCQARQNALSLKVEKGAPFASLPLQDWGEGIKAPERLSLGSHRAQDWTLMGRRQNLAELLPLWFCLGQITPAIPAETHIGTALLLENCRQAIQRREGIVPAFLQLFQAGFKGMLVPRLEDEQHQGFGLPPVSHSQTSPLILLTEGAALIRSLFFQQQDRHLSLLPALPPEFHCGRMVGLTCRPFGTLDLEWTKKQLRRLIFHAEESAQLIFSFPKDRKQFRLRERDDAKGSLFFCGQPFPIEKGKEYLLDNFRT